MRGRPLPKSLPRFKQVFGALARCAEDKGVQLAFENCAMGGDWQSGDWNIALNLADWEMMFDVVSESHVGLEWEPCHQMVALVDPLAQLRQWISKIIHVHGKDTSIYWDVVKAQGVLGPKPFADRCTKGNGKRPVRCRVCTTSNSVAASSCPTRNEPLSGSVVSDIGKQGQN